MALASRIVAVRKALVAGLVAEFDEKKLQITYGYLGHDESRQREQMWTDNPRSTQDPAALRAGRNPRNEDMTFNLAYMAMDPRLKPDELDDIVIGRVAVVDEWVADRKNNELGVEGLQWFRHESFEMKNMLPTSGSGSMTLTQWTFRYNARLI